MILCSYYILSPFFLGMVVGVEERAFACEGILVSDLYLPASSNEGKGEKYCKLDLMEIFHHVEHSRYNCSIR